MSYLLFSYVVLDDLRHLSVEAWDEVLLASPNTTLFESINTFQGHISEFCGAGEATNLPSLKFLPNNDATTNTPRHPYYGTVVSVNKNTIVHYQTVLLFIFACTGFFNLYRVCSITFDTYHQRYVLVSSVLYTPHEPEFSRWLEYVLTSPLQIMLICNTVAIGNNDALLSMVCLQAMLVISGFLSEIMIQQIYICNGYHPITKNVLQILTVLCLQWIAFSIIWNSIISRYFRNKYAVQQCGTQENSNFTCNTQENMHTCHLFDICEWNSLMKTCENNNYIPNSVDLVVFGQFILFFLFGIVHTAQILLSFCFQTTYIGEKWLSCSFIYSILSITAKILLFVAILIIANELPS